MVRVTGVVLTYDRPSMLPAALAGLKDCDELLVVSGGPKEVDEVVAGAGARVVHHETSRSTGGFAGLRNLALSQVKTEYAFFLDDDETVSPALVSFIRSVESGPAWGAVRRYNMRRPGFYWPAEYPDWQIRFVRTDQRWEGQLHESLVRSGPGGVKLPEHIFHWGWACKYALAPRFRSYDRVGGQAVDNEDIEHVWHWLGKKPTAPVLMDPSVPIPKPVLAEWGVEA